MKLHLQGSRVGVSKMTASHDRLSAAMQRVVCRSNELEDMFTDVTSKIVMQQAELRNAIINMTREMEGVGYSPINLFATSGEPPKHEEIRSTLVGTPSRYGSFLSVTSYEESSKADTVARRQSKMMSLTKEPSSLSLRSPSVRPEHYIRNFVEPHSTAFELK